MPRRHLPLVHQDKDGDFYGACNCGATSGPNRFPKVHRWKAEDWVREHQQLVDQALSHLHHGGGSLRTERDHALKMMEDPNTPAKDKPLWKVLYDGAEARLRDAGPPDPTSEGLF